MSRDRAIAVFLAAAGWGDAQRAPLAGDASTRRYERLERSGDATQRAVLMDADPSRGAEVGSFLAVAAHLAALGFSAPVILAADRGAGLLLLEDLGDDLFTAVVARDPALERSLYAAAIDLLVALHAHPAPDRVPRYGPAEMAERAALAAIWYRPGAGDTPVDAPTVRRLRDACHAALEAAAPETPVLALRDYHAQNLLWLPDREGVARVGLLDFQDAMAGHPAYDLVSLLEDARRDVPADIRVAMMARFAEGSGIAAEDLAAAAAVLGAQRALRILGVFARLSMHFGKPGYVDLLPRVWDHLRRDLAHPAAQGLRQVVDDILPPPTPAARAALKARAGSCPDLAGPPGAPTGATAP